LNPDEVSADHSVWELVTADVVLRVVIAIVPLFMAASHRQRMFFSAPHPVRRARLADRAEPAGRIILASLPRGGFWMAHLPVASRFVRVGNQISCGQNSRLPLC